MYFRIYEDGWIVKESDFEQFVHTLLDYTEVFVPHVLIEYIRNNLF